MNALQQKVDFAINVVLKIIPISNATSNSILWLIASIVAKKDTLLGIAQPTKKDYIKKVAPVLVVVQ